MSKKKRNELIQTSITIKTEKLNEHLKKYLVRNNLVDIVTGICGVVTGWSLAHETVELSDKVPTFFNPIGIALMLFSLYACYRVIFPKTKKLVNDIIKTLYESKDYTAIVLMKAQIGGVPKILVQRQESWQSYFLPYCHFSEGDTEGAIKKSLRQELANILDMPEHIFIIEEYKGNPFYRIKKNVSQDVTRLIQFRFYFVQLKNEMSRNRFMKSHFPKFSWKSKLELSQDIGTINNNGDVLAIIDQESLIQKTPYAFSDNLLSLKESDRTFRIIWTITNKCNYQCNMCATNSGPDASDLDLEQKRKILMNLASINLNIESLDISGGDPLLDPENQKLIRQCYQLLPFTKISVTTTALGMDRVSLSDLSSTVRRCDITYDIPCKKYENNSDDQSASRLRPYEYNKSNLDKLLSIREAGMEIDLNIHVPIHTETTNREDIEVLLADLERVHPKSIKFIQLMPVGRLKPEHIQKEYEPKKFMELVDTIVKEKGYNFSISMSCALKTQANVFRKNKARSCPMLEEKLGIDSNGNVFACMWGAYLNGYADVNENPFFLGNLLEKSLFDIIKEPHSDIKKLKEQAKGGCPVCNEAARLQKEKQNDQTISAKSRSADTNIFSCVRNRMRKVDN